MRNLNIMNVLATEFEGVLLFEPRVFPDDRGYFLELWNQTRYSAAGLSTSFVQDNMSYSKRGVLRGLHLQHPRAQGKLVSVLQGEIWDVVIDVRRGSPSFGRWWGVTLSSQNKRQLYVPEGFAHGFAVTGEDALVLYKTTAEFAGGDETTVLWSDPALAITWPIVSPIVSAKDNLGLHLKEVPEDRLPLYLAGDR